MYFEKGKAVVPLSKDFYLTGGGGIDLIEILEDGHHCDGQESEEGGKVDIFMH